MAPKKPSTMTAPAAKPKANTKAKVTKPDPKTSAPKKAAAAKKALKSSPAPTTHKASGRKTAGAAAPKAATKTTAARKPAAKAAPKKTAAAPAASKTSSVAASHKRKAGDETAPPPAKKAKTTATKAAPKKAPAPRARKSPPPPKAPKLPKKGPIINTAPTERMNVYVFGEGSAGELGLGTAPNAIDVQRPRLNQNLSAADVGVVQIVAGGMHALALTHDGRILSWGVNDGGALGRDVTHNGGMVDADNPDEVDSDDGNGLNPKECTPTEVDWSETPLAEGTRFVQVAAGDSCSFALTDDGRVYGWGTFRSNEGPYAFDRETETAHRPKLISEVSKITSIKAGANHAYALSNKGEVFAWGSGEQHQLGRKVVDRSKREGLRPRTFGLPKGPKNGIATIETGGYHGFAISKNGDVYSWGLNNFGQTGSPDDIGNDDAVVTQPKIIKPLHGTTIVSLTGGAHHSIAATSEGDCLVWGRVDNNQMGIPADVLKQLPEEAIVLKDDNVRIVAIPQKVTAIKGSVIHVSTDTDTNVVVTKEGKAWSWGFSENYQTGVGSTTDVRVPTMMENNAIREKRITGAEEGGQYGIITAYASDDRA